MKRIKVVELYKNYEKYYDKDIVLSGWIIRKRNAKGGSLVFLDFTDGTYASEVRCIVEGEDLIKLTDNINDGYSVKIDGTVVESPANCTQEFEINVNSIEIYGKTDSYPIHKSNIGNMVSLRTIPHFRSRTLINASIFRMRSGLIDAMREFFKNRHIYQVDPNVLTASDCEGAGEMFTVTPNIFNKSKVGLTVSSQLQLEAIACSMGDVYTMNKSFRAEKSFTNKHVSEFMHVEAELTFINLNDLINFTEDFVKHCIKYMIVNFSKEYDMFDNSRRLVSCKNRRDMLVKYLNSEFRVITYDDAIRVIQDDLKAKKVKMKIRPKYGDDLGSEHEKYLVEKYDTFVFVTHWPLNIKSFYMKYGGNGTCESFDLLAPDVGELFGGSMREDNYDLLVSEMKKRNMNTSVLDWYIELRQNGTVPHGGWGCGFDRMLMFLTGLESIKDVIPFPVHPDNCKY
jgi:asparaginyl-tRNA synthetase